MQRAHSSNRFSRTMMKRVGFGKSRIWYLQLSWVCALWTAHDPRGFDAINDYDSLEWLRLNGASERSLNSGYLMRAVRPGIWLRRGRLTVAPGWRRVRRFAALYVCFSRIAARFSGNSAQVWAMSFSLPFTTY